MFMGNSFGIRNHSILAVINFVPSGEFIAKTSPYYRQHFCTGYPRAGTVWYANRCETVKISRLEKYDLFLWYDIFSSLPPARPPNSDAESNSLEHHPNYTRVFLYNFTSLKNNPSLPVIFAPKGLLCRESKKSDVRPLVTSVCPSVRPSVRRLKNGSKISMKIVPLSGET